MAKSVDNDGAICHIIKDSLSAGTGGPRHSLPNLVPARRVGL